MATGYNCYKPPSPPICWWMHKTLRKMRKLPRQLKKLIKVTKVTETTTNKNKVDIIGPTNQFHWNALATNRHIIFLLHTWNQRSNTSMLVVQIRHCIYDVSHVDENCRTALHHATRTWKKLVSMHFRQEYHTRIHVWCFIESDCDSTTIVAAFFPINKIIWMVNAILWRLPVRSPLHTRTSLQRKLGDNDCSKT